MTGYTGTMGALAGLVVAGLFTAALDAAPLAAQGMDPESRRLAFGESLVAAERAFAARALESDTRTAFLEVLAEDGVLFAPNAVNGRALWEARPVTEARLEWEPTFAEISPDGTLGFTTGPYVATPPPAPDGTARPQGTGRYFSIWRGDGSDFELVLDIGTVGTPATAPELVLMSHDTETLGRPVFESSAATADERWRAWVQREGTDGAFERLGGHRALVLRDQRVLRMGSTDLDARPVEDPVVFSTEVEASGCSRDGVLCFFHGRWRAPGDANDRNWVRVWRAHRDGGWMLVVDLRQGGG